MVRRVPRVQRVRQERQVRPVVPRVPKDRLVPMEQVLRVQRERMVLVGWWERQVPRVR